MAGRLADLRSGLADGAEGEAAKRKVVLALLSAFPTYGLDAKGAGTMAALYVRALVDLPTWAVQAAASRFLQGRTLTEWSGDKCPTPPQVTAESRRSLDAIHAEIKTLCEVLDAVVYQPISDAERQRVLDDIAAAPNSLLIAGRTPRLAAPPSLAGSAVSDIVAPLRGLDLSHLMERLDRRRVSA
ncbi:hypothetical protein [Methylobacterium gossipiicola]|uniref:Uncharacterized protein n=1 Tax=Methylobacterium gossipiicola TaxID=582675 RepID=A0A1I2TK89_9HYPH|nr:hypothetical protein [Methylobacterium gossipiicola]SFG65332.1 hypothetical protein SAMN05192565_107172 [Methylobacterium gossipiicola]